MNQFAHATAAVLFVLAICSSVAVSATLKGQVRDAAGHLVPYAIVQIQRDRSPAVTLHTDAEGRYRFDSKISGIYRIDAQYGALGRVTVDRFPLQESEAKVLDLNLKPETDSADFFDPPTFTVAGVTDNTYLGGHGSDTVTRSKEALAKETNTLRDQQASSPDPVATVLTLQANAERDPTEPNLFDWGAELLAHGAPEAAFEIFNRGIQLFPQSSRMLLGAACAAYARGEYPEAMRRFFAATDLRPGDPAPYLFLTKVKAPQISETDGFVARMERFVKLHPENAWAQYSYASALWRTRSDRPPVASEVLSLLRKALLLDPNMGAAYLELGIVYSEQRDLPNAIHAYQTAIQMDPKMEEAHYRLAQAYRQSGSTQKALEESAIFEQLSQTSELKADRERSEMQKFVVTLKTSSEH